MIFLVCILSNIVVIASVQIIVLEVAYKLVPALNHHVGSVNVTIAVRLALSSSWLALGGSISGLLGCSLLCIARFGLDGRHVGVAPFVFAGVV